MEQGLDSERAKGFLLHIEKQDPYCNTGLVNYVIGKAVEAGFRNWNEVAKAFQYSNPNKVWKALQEFVLTGNLIQPYFDKLVEILHLEPTHLKHLEARHNEELTRELSFLREQYRFFLTQIDKILAEERFYNVTFYGLQMGTAYISRGFPFVFGELLIHWKNKKFMVRNKCCGVVYIHQAGGSPLTGANEFTGFCSKCKQVITGSTDFRKLLHPYMLHKPLYPYSKSQETLFTIYEKLRTT